MEEMSSSGEQSGALGMGKQSRFTNTGGCLKEPWFDVVYGSGLNGRGHSGCSDRHRHKIVEYCHVGRTLHPTGS